MITTLICWLLGERLVECLAYGQDLGPEWLRE